MAQLLTVACVLRSGGDYDAEYVDRLWSSVHQNMPRGETYKFVCFSDVPVPCERVPLLHDWPGWWAKMELFRMCGPVLYFDLDTVIVGDLTDLAAQARNGGFTMLSDFFRPERAQSGVMAWDGMQHDIYRGFRESASLRMTEFRGDGEYLASLFPDGSRWQDVLPGQVVSRKVTTTRNPNERVVCFHGEPRPRAVGWVV